jgi:hypothetical protein
MGEPANDPSVERASTITIGLREKSNGYCLSIRAEGTTKPIESRLFTAADMVRWKDRLVERLRMLRDLWWQYEVNKNKYEVNNRDFAKVSRSIELLHSFSDIFLAELFGKGGSSLLGQYLDQARQARISDLLEWERPIGIMEYEARLDEFLPLDYLFLPHKEYNNAPKNLHELVLSLSNIIGFSYIIRRNPPRDDEQDSASHKTRQNAVVGKRQAIIEYDDRLSADILAFLNLPYAEKEIVFFQGTNSHVFKVAEDPKQCGEHTAKTIIDRLLGRGDVQLYHFCCHCSAEGHDTWKHFLKLGESTMTIENLKHFSEMRPISSQVGAGDRMTFLNACEGAAVTPLSKSSFPELFLDYFKHVAFIGPESDIPDAFAYEFARVFYAYLFKLKDLGMALFKARWFFAKKYNNPMGLFYTFYANGDVRLAGPDRSVHL